MKIAYIISSIKSKSGGLGGHYHSLVVTNKVISDYCDTFIINVGTEPAKAINDDSSKLYTVITKNFRFFYIYKKVMEIMNTERPDIIHAFDNLSFFWARLVGRILHIPYCLTKCGGENPKFYWPYFDNIILYSIENLEYFKSKNKFKSSNMHLIPNRVENFIIDKKRVREMLDNLNNKHLYSIKIMRIARISSYYKKSIFQLINLMRKLRKDGIDCCVVIVGTVEELSVLQEIKNASTEHLFIFNESYYTRNAKELIEVGDIFLGTGRSFMEAASLGKVMLCPIVNSEIPLLINNDNLLAAFRYNFSERVFIENYDEDKNYLSILNALKKEENLNKLKAFIYAASEEYFAAKSLAPKHMQVYNTIIKNTKSLPHLADFFLHLLFLIRKYYL